MFVVTPDESALVVAGFDSGTVSVVDLETESLCAWPKLPRARSAERFPS